jgi:hypothetical protein
MTYIHAYHATRGADHHPSPHSSLPLASRKSLSESGFSAAC